MIGYYISCSIHSSYTMHSVQKETMISCVVSACRTAMSTGLVPRPFQKGLRTKLCVYNVKMVALVMLVQEHAHVHLGSPGTSAPVRHVMPSSLHTSQVQAHSQNFQKGGLWDPAQEVGTGRKLRKCTIFESLKNGPGDDFTFFFFFFSYNNSVINDKEYMYIAIG